MQWRSVARHVGHRPLYGAYEAGGINPPLKLLCAVVLRLCWLGAMHANLASSDSPRPAPRIAACDSKLVVHKVLKNLVLASLGSIKRTEN